MANYNVRGRRRRTVPKTVLSRAVKRLRKIARRMQKLTHSVPISIIRGAQSQNQQEIMFFQTTAVEPGLTPYEDNEEEEGDDQKADNTKAAVENHMKENESVYCDYKTLTVLIGTYNVNDQPPSVGLSPWLSENIDKPPDIYAIGFQEFDLSLIDMTIGGTTESVKEEQWKMVVERSLHPYEKYTLVDKVRLAGILLFIYAKTDLRRVVTEGSIVKGNVSTGTLNFLMQQKKNKRAFGDYQEQDMNFPPTYKYNINTDSWDSSEKQRAPAWCDRVLWAEYSSVEVKPIRYESVPEIRISDHKPVRALFEVKARHIDKNKRKEVFEQALKEADKLANEELPNVDIEPADGTGQDDELDIRPINCKKIPLELYRLVDHLVKHGLDTQNLFSQDVSPADFIAIRNSLDTGVPAELPGAVHSVAEALIRLLDSFPEPVIPMKFLGRAFKAANSPKECWALVYDITGLHPCHGKTLEYLVEFFRKLLRHSEENKTTLDYLSTFFSTVLFRLDTGINEGTILTANAKTLQAVVESHNNRLAASIKFLRTLIEIDKKIVELEDPDDVLGTISR